MLSTSHKITVARWAYRCVKGVRSVLGRPNATQIRRSGINWAVDLNEGIDLSIYLLGGFEIATLRLYERVIKTGDTVLDIGANIGAHTLPLAKLVGPAGRVLAFEPTSFAFEKLCRNMELNAPLATRISATQVMLADSDDYRLPAHIFSSWPLSDEPDVHEKHKGQLKTTDGARTLTVDAAIREAQLERVDFVKLDVDGYECSVLKGATGMLSSSRPVILMELAPYLFRDTPDEFSAMLALFRELDYDMTDALTKRSYPLDRAALEILIPDGVSRNVLLRAG